MDPGEGEGTKSSPSPSPSYQLPQPGQTRCPSPKPSPLARKKRPPPPTREPPPPSLSLSTPIPNIPITTQSPTLPSPTAPSTSTTPSTSTSLSTSTPTTSTTPRSPKGPPVRIHRPVVNQSSWTAPSKGNFENGKRPKRSASVVSDEFDENRPRKSTLFLGSKCHSQPDSEAQPTTPSGPSIEGHQTKNVRLVPRGSRRPTNGPTPNSFERTHSLPVETMTSVSASCHKVSQPEGPQPTPPKKPKKDKKGGSHIEFGTKEIKKKRRPTKSGPVDVSQIVNYKGPISVSESPPGSPVHSPVRFRPTVRLQSSPRTQSPPPTSTTLRLSPTKTLSKSTGSSSSQLEPSQRISFSSLPTGAPSHSPSSSPSESSTPSSTSSSPSPRANLPSSGTSPSPRTNLPSSASVASPSPRANLPSSVASPSPRANLPSSVASPSPRANLPSSAASPSPRTKLPSSQASLSALVSEEEEKEVENVPSHLRSYIQHGDPEEDFELVRQIGKGAHGVVYQGINRLNGKAVAIKKVIVQPKNIHEIVNELKVIVGCDAAYCVECYGSYYKGGELWVILQLFDAGSLDDIMKEKKSLTEIEIATIVFQVLPALHYLHEERHLLHRDIKGGNMLLNSLGQVRLADFGISRTLDRQEKAQTQVGSPFWMSPELITGSGYDQKADVWALGITILEMTDADHPFFDALPMTAMFNIVQQPPPVPNGEWSDLFRDFIGKCLDKDPALRATCKDLLSHPWLSQFSLYVPPSPSDPNPPPEPPAGSVNAEDVVKSLVEVFQSQREKTKEKETAMLGNLRSTPSSASLIPSPQKGKSRQNSVAGDSKFDERLIRLKFPDGTVQTLLVHRKDTRETICRKLAQTSGIMDDIDIQHHSLMFFHPKKSASVAVSANESIMSLIEGLSDQEIGDRVLFHFQEIPDTQSYTLMKEILRDHLLTQKSGNSLAQLMFAPNLSLVMALFKVVKMRDLEKLAPAILAVFGRMKQIPRLLKRIAAREVFSNSAVNSLFRGTDSATGKLLSLYAQSVDQTFLSKVLSPVFEHVLSIETPVELDVSRIASSGDLKKDLFTLKANIQKMERISDLAMNSIIKSVDLIPIELRHIVREIQKVVTRHHNDRQYMVPSAVLFSRLLCPALIFPEKYGIRVSRPLTSHGKRTLMMMSKVLSATSSGRLFKDADFMKDMNSFVERNREVMEKYFESVMDFTDTDLSSLSYSSSSGEVCLDGDGLRNMEIIASFFRPHTSAIGQTLGIL